MAAGWFKQAITQSDNKTYEGAYLALAAIIGLVIITILCMIALAAAELSLCDRTMQKECFNPAGLGGGIAAAIASVGAFLGGVGAFIALDRRQEAPAASSTTTKTEKETITKVEATPAASAPAATEVDILAAGRGVQPLTPMIGPEDVGKNVALVGNRKKRRPTKAKSPRNR